MELLNKEIPYRMYPSRYSVSPYDKLSYAEYGRLFDIIRSHIHNHIFPIHSVIRESLIC